MTILEGDIQIVTSQIMGDFDEAGGRATSTEVIDGSSNAVFADISQLDRTYGRVNLAKLHVKVNVPTTESYMGANVIIADTPDDDNVSCTLFTTKDGFDTRKDAQSRLESYVVAGPLSSMRLYGDQLIGQKAILCYQREDAPLPEVGQVHVLSVENGVTATQYFRIEKVESIVSTFSDSQGEFKRRVLTLRISDALRQTFKGEEPLRSISDANNNNVARVRKTSVADSARYYSTRPLSVAAALGDFTVKVDSIFNALVPSSTQETPIVLGEIFGKSLVVKSGESVTLPSSVWADDKVHVRGGIAPRSVVLSNGATNAYWPKKDDGKGNVVLPDDVTVVGSVDYASGLITQDTTKLGAWGSVSSITFERGTSFSQIAFTDSQTIGLANRGSVYVATLLPLPAVGTLTVDYMSQGKWYRLSDLGDGKLTGDDVSVGTGRVDFTNGGMMVTLGALPDVDSDVIYSWGSQIDTSISLNSNTNIRSQFNVPFGSVIEPGSASITYVKDGVTKTLTDAANKGVLVGGGESGVIEFLQNFQRVTINGPRDPDTAISVSFKNLGSGDGAGSGGGTFNANHVDGKLSFSIGHEVVRKLLNLEYDVYIADVGEDGVERWPWTIGGGSNTSSIIRLKVRDDGNGVLTLYSYDAGVIGAGVFNVDVGGTNEVPVGTVDYATGAISLNVRCDIYLKKPVFVNMPMGTDPVNGRPIPDIRVYKGVDLKKFVSSVNPTNQVQVIVAFSNAAQNAPSSTFEVSPPLSFSVRNGVKNLVANSLVFTLQSGQTVYEYVDRNGTVIRDASYTTGSGVSVGNVDYANSIVTLTSWPSTLDSAPVSVKSCLLNVQGRLMPSATFRTAGAPIRVGSLYIQAANERGATITGTSSNAGTVVGDITGRVNATTGVVKVDFATPVSPNTVRYNAVVQSSMPLDASILGLDPVRLPSDGRVPVFRMGEVVVIHNTQTTVATTVSNGQTVNVGRTRLACITVRDKNNAVVTTGFSTDLDAGTVTFSNIAGMQQPITIEHRIEDMSLVSDAQIGGTLRLSKPITHAFPLGSKVSSALLMGDMQARIPVLFDQATWTGNLWQDSINGSQATATFNDALYPIVVTNAGAITERWVVRFTNTTAFEVIGEHVGVIAVGNVTTNCAPINPAENTPYFTINANAWGSGWAAGNILRFNTVGAQFPIWVARTIQQGQATAQSDSFTLLVRGDIDRN